MSGGEGGREEEAKEAGGGVLRTGERTGTSLSPKVAARLSRRGSRTRLLNAVPPADARESPVGTCCEQRGGGGGRFADHSIVRGVGLLHPGTTTKQPRRRTPLLLLLLPVLNHSGRNAGAQDNGPVVSSSGLRPGGPMYSRAAQSLRQQQQHQQRRWEENLADRGGRWSSA